MKSQDLGKKFKLWQIIALVQLVIIITLGLLVYNQQQTLIVQNTYVQGLKDAIAIREGRVKVLSSRLISAMALLQSAAQELTQDGIAIEEVK